MKHARLSDGITFPTDHVARRLWKSPYHQLARSSGLGLIVFGYVGLVGYGIFEWIRNDGPVLPRLGIAAIALGTLMLLFTFIRERLTTHAVDPYKEIER